MSKCISAHGEYSEHEGAGEFCDWCGACNHDAIIAAAEQRGAIKALREAAKLSRMCWTSNKNLIDPNDTETSYSFDRWLEVLAGQMEGDDADA